jgi:hypothetical protein
VRVYKQVIVLVWLLAGWSEVEQLEKALVRSLPEAVAHKREAQIALTGSVSLQCVLAGIFVAWSR